jgi:hypothetical protein
MAYITTNAVLYVVMKPRFSHSDMSKFILVKAFCQLHLVILMSVFIKGYKGWWKGYKSDGSGDKGDERMLRDDKKWWRGYLNKPKNIIIIIFSNVEIWHEVVEQWWKQ